MVNYVPKGRDSLPIRDIFPQGKALLHLVANNLQWEVLVMRALPLSVSCFPLKPRLERRDLDCTCVRSNLGVRSYG